MLLLASYLRAQAFRFRRAALDSRGETSLGTLLGIGLLLFLYWRFPGLFNSFIHFCVVQFQQALKSVPPKQKAPGSTVPTATTK